LYQKTGVNTARTLYVVLFRSKLSLPSAITIANCALSDSFFLFVLRRAFLSQLAGEGGGRIQIGRQLKIYASSCIFPLRQANFLQNFLCKYNNSCTVTCTQIGIKHQKSSNGRPCMPCLLEGWLINPADPIRVSIV
jgi:hypothetical protein